MIYDFQAHKNNKEKELLDLRAGIAILQRTLKELNINTANELNSIKSNMRLTIKQLSKKIDEKSTRHK